TTGFVEAELATRSNLRAVGRAEPYPQIAVAEHGTADLGAVVLQCQVPVARGRLRQVGDFALDGDGGKTLFQQTPGQLVQGRDAENAQLSRIVAVHVVRYVIKAIHHGRQFT